MYSGKTHHIVDGHSIELDIMRALYIKNKKKERNYEKKIIKYVYGVFNDVHHNDTYHCTS